MRLTPFSLYQELFPTRDDPENPGHYLCRYCGKPTTHTRRRYYCGDDCHDLCQKAVSWGHARASTWIRDNKQCSLCKTPVELYKDKYGAQCHHIIPVKDLHWVAYDAVKGEYWDEFDKESITYWFVKFYTMLYLDINNLTTLCHKCHKMVHRADLRNQKRFNEFKVARTKWGGFWKLNEASRYTRTLEDFSLSNEASVTIGKG